MRAIQKNVPNWPGVYVIENVTTNTFYVGSTVNMRKRWNYHRMELRRGSHHSAHLQNAWNKYGEGAFVFIPLQLIVEKERRLLAEQGFLDGFSNSYNIARRAQSCAGVKRSAETKARMRASFTSARREHARELGRAPKSTEHRARIGEANAGRKQSEGARAKMRAAWEKRRAK